MAKIKPPKLERLVGMEVYKSETPGIGGKLKLAPEDFIVEEITPGGQILEVCGFKEHVTGYVPENETEIYGEYTHFVLKKCNWDTMRAIKEISRRLGISRGRLSFAGTKDKRALTVQRVSVRNVPIENLTNIRIKDIILGGFEYADDRVDVEDRPELTSEFVHLSELKLNIDIVHLIKNENEIISEIVIGEGSSISDTKTLDKLKSSLSVLYKTGFDPGSHNSDLDAAATSWSGS